MDSFYMVRNPVIITDDKESRAIVKYLEQKYKGKGTELVPTDLKAYGLAEQGAYLESQCFEPQSSPLLRELFFRK